MKEPVIVEKTPENQNACSILYGPCNKSKKKTPCGPFVCIISFCNTRRFNKAFLLDIS